MRYTKEEARKKYRRVKFYGDVTIKTHVTIEPGARIGKNVYLDTGCTIKSFARVGEGTYIGTGITIQKYEIVKPERLLTTGTILNFN